jgi:hypothetical protein
VVSAARYNCDTDLSPRFLFRSKNVNNTSSCSLDAMFALCSLRCWSFSHFTWLGILRRFQIDAYGLEIYSSWPHAGASFWKMHHMTERRKVQNFYAKLEAGEITVQAVEWSESVHFQAIHFIYAEGNERCTGNVSCHVSQCCSLIHSHLAGGTYSLHNGFWSPSKFMRSAIRLLESCYRYWACLIGARQPASLAIARGRSVNII